jgi:hypothetical protein
VVVSADVTLDPWQFKACMDLAATRMATSNEAGWNHASTYRRTYLLRATQEITGACGEMAAAIALDIFWSPSVNTFHAIPDLPFGIEVRSSTDPKYNLIVRANDPDDRAYVLVLGEPPDLTVVGWYIGADAKRDEYARNPHGMRDCWIVPNAELHDVDVLREHIADQKAKRKEGS